MIAILAFVIFCTEISAVPTGREAIVYPSLTTLRSGEKRLSFRALDQDFNLKLQPAGDIISEGFYIESTQDEGRSDDNSRVDIHKIKQNLYKDAETGASLHIEERDLLQIKGIINSKLRIQPHGSEMRRDGKVAHRIVEVENDDYFPSHLNDEVYMSRPNTDVNETADERRFGEIYYVEICIITDIEFTYTFRNDYELLVYVSVLFNGMQLRYDNLKDIKVVLILSGIKIVKSERDQPYIQNHMVDKYTEVTGCLNDFAQYVSKTVSPSHDIVLLLTKRQIADVENGKIVPNVLGIAYVGGACDALYRVGIGEDNALTWSGIGTNAHEIAHLLGCGHDGDPPSSYLPGHPGSSGCPWDDGYLMSYVRNSNKQYYFSPCCEKCIDYMFRVANCLRRNNTGKSIKNSDLIPGEALEKQFSVSAFNYDTDKKTYYDNRCRNALDNSVFTYKFPADNCDFSCRTPTKNGYFSYWIFSCMDGDMCNTGKRCMNGECK